MSKVLPIVESGARWPAPLSSRRERHHATMTGASVATKAGINPPVNRAAIDRPGVTEPIVISTKAWRDRLRHRARRSQQRRQGQCRYAIVRLLVGGGGGIGGQ
jgi:hypothetical protein